MAIKSSADVTAGQAAPEAASHVGARPKILLAAIPTGGGRGRVHGSTPGGDVYGSALCECGAGLSGHLSSSVNFAKHDMGLTSNWKHEYYEAHAPDGFDLVWVDDVATDPRWQAALALNKIRQAEAEAAIAKAEQR